MSAGVRSKIGMAGRITNFPVKQLVRILQLSSRSGVLLLSSGENRGRIDFKDGNILRAATSTGYSSIGNVLVRLGVIDHQRLKLASDVQKGLAKPQALGAVLIELGYANRGDIQEAMQVQVQEVLRQLLEWADGEFEFEERDGEAVDDISVEVADLLLESRWGVSAPGPGKPRKAERRRATVCYFTLDAAPGKFEISLERAGAQVERIVLDEAGAGRPAGGAGADLLVADLTGVPRAGRAGALAAVARLAEQNRARPLVIVHGPLERSYKRDLASAGARAFVKLTERRAWVEWALSGPVEAAERILQGTGPRASGAETPDRG